MGPTASSSTGFAPGSLPSGPSFAQAGGAAPLDAITISVVASILSLPASLLGSGTAIRPASGNHRRDARLRRRGLGDCRHRRCFSVALAISASSLRAHSAGRFRRSDSGVTAAADAQYRGATLALHSMVGFGLSALGGWAVGVAIDAAGGANSAHGWTAAFLVMGGASCSGRWPCGGHARARERRFEPRCITRSRSLRRRSW